MKRIYDGVRPPIVLDIEASGFGNGSYPIEIGFAAQNSIRYCSLIKPFPNWTHWSESAEEAHGISREELMLRGRNPKDVVLELNHRLKGKQIYSDGWVVDHPWLMKLFFAVNVEPTFQLSPIELIMTENQIEIWDEVHEEVLACNELQRHRASVDAWVIQQTWIKSHYMTQ